MRFLKKLFGGLPKRRAGGYEGAATGRRLGNWTPGNDGANSLLFRDASLMRSRSRDLVRRNAWAANAVDSLVANMIGFRNQTPIYPWGPSDQGKDSGHLA